MVGLIAALSVFCKVYHVYNKDESFYYLRKTLGVGHGWHSNEWQHMNLIFVYWNTTNAFFLSRCLRETAGIMFCAWNSSCHKCRHNPHDAAGLQNF